MGKKVLLGYLIFSVIFFAGLVVWFVIMANNVKIRAFELATEDFYEAKDLLYEEILNGESLPVIANSIFDNNNNLESLVLYTVNNGIWYLKSRMTNQIARYNVSGQPIAWKGEPIYNINTSTSKIFTADLMFDESGNTITLDMVYGVLPQSEIYPMIKRSLIIVLLFIVLTLLVVIITPKTQAEKAGASEKKGLKENQRSGFPGSNMKDPMPEPFNDQDLSLARKNEQFNMQRKAETAPLVRSNSIGPNYPKTSSQKISEIRKPKSQSEQLYSPTSSLVWGAFLKERLAQELKRSTAFNQDLSLALIVCKDFAKVDRKRLYDKVISHFEYNDLIFEWKDNYGIAVIFPNAALHEAAKSVDGLKSSLQKDEYSKGFRFFSGITSRKGRLVASERLLKEAEKTLEKAIATRRSNILLFQIDLKKYYDLLRKKKA